VDAAGPKVRAQADEVGRKSPLGGRALTAGEPLDEVDSGGDPVCWAHLVCPQCGAMESAGHRQVCPAAPAPAAAGAGQQDGRNGPVSQQRK
jgi:hypothetical protein